MKLHGVPPADRLYQSLCLRVDQVVAVNDFAQTRDAVSSRLQVRSLGDPYKIAIRQFFEDVEHILASCG
jgi:hypothetical protein